MGSIDDEIDERIADAVGDLDSRIETQVEKTLEEWEVVHDDNVCDAIRSHIGCVDDDEAAEIARRGMTVLLGEDWLERLTNPNRKVMHGD